MSVFYNFLIAGFFAFIGLITPILLNIIQNGSVLTDDKLKSINEITGKQAETLKPKDIMKLTKKQVFQLFQTLPPVQVELLNTNYVAENLPQAVLAKLIQIITDHIFGPGKWIGKGFKNLDRIEGYNIFQPKVGKKKVGRPFLVSIETSEIDERACTKLDYRQLNRDFISGSMRDEIRMINEKLFLGMGITTWGLGSRNPAHFILYKGNKD